MEVPELVWKQLADIEEGEGANPQEMRFHSGGHDARHLTVLIPLDVDSPVDGQGGQLVVLLSLL